MREIRRREHVIEWTLGVELVVLTIVFPLLLTSTHLKNIGSVYKWTVWEGVLLLGISFIIGFLWLAFSKTTQYESFQELRINLRQDGSPLFNYIEKRASEINPKLGKPVAESFGDSIDEFPYFPKDFKRLVKRIKWAYWTNMALCFVGSCLVIVPLFIYATKVLLK